MGFWPKLSESPQGSRYHVEQARWLENATKRLLNSTYRNGLDQFQGNRLVESKTFDTVGSYV